MKAKKPQKYTEHMHFMVQPDMKTAAQVLGVDISEACRSGLEKAIVAKRKKLKKQLLGS